MSENILSLKKKKRKQKQQKKTTTKNQEKKKKKKKKKKTLKEYRILHHALRVYFALKIGVL